MEVDAMLVIIGSVDSGRLATQTTDNHTRPVYHVTAYSYYKRLEPVQTTAIMRRVDLN